MSRFLKSNNPVLSDKAIDSALSKEKNNGTIISEETRTVEGAINKTFMLFGLMMITTYISYMNPSYVNLLVGAIGSLIAVIVASFKSRLLLLRHPSMLYWKDYLSVRLLLSIVLRQGA